MGLDGPEGAWIDTTFTITVTWQTLLMHEPIAICRWSGMDSPARDRIRRACDYVIYTSLELHKRHMSKGLGKPDLSKNDRIDLRHTWEAILILEDEIRRRRGTTDIYL